MQFIMGLPMSLVQCLIAIVKRKIKAVMIAMTPAPPLPLPEQTPVPPTSKDVVQPQETWDDVKSMLVDGYKFSDADADEIISKVQEFYDGSDESVQVITRVRREESLAKEGGEDELPVFEDMKRYPMTAPYCKNTWIPSRVDRVEVIGEGYCYILKPPVKVSDTDWSGGKFHMWIGDSEEEKFNHDGEWSLLKEYTSATSSE